MCGIFGVIAHESGKLSEQERLTWLNDLFLLSESRGKEAAGILTGTPEELIMYRAPLTGSGFINTRDYRDLAKASWRMMIGHSRLATNGIHFDNRNNQPVGSGGFLGVHNGIVTNDRELWEKRLGQMPKTQVDTEVVMALLEHYYPAYDLMGAAQKTFGLLEGAATVAVRSVYDDRILLVTNTGSLYFSWVARRKFLVFGSEQYILEQWLLRQQLDGEIRQLEAGTGMVVDGKKLVAQAFSLSDKARLHRVKKVEARYSVRDVSTYETGGHKKSGLNDLRELRKHEFDYNAIYVIPRCSKCILPATTPFIAFDERGICNYCLQHEPITYKGKAALEKIIAPFRSKSGKADCIVGFSGGRDSSYGLHLVKKELGLNPIAYTFDWGMLSDLGRQNAARVTGKLGVEHILVSADIATKRANIVKNVLAWMKKPDLGMVPLFMAGDKESEYHMNELVKKTGIKLILYFRGNSFERDEFKTGHAGVSNADPGGVIHHLAWTGKVQLALYYGRQFLANPAYLNSSIVDTAKAYAATYLIPHNYIYLWHYLPWEERKVISTLRREYNWQGASDNPATWRIDDGSPAFYNYIYYQVQGFTEHDSLRSHQIREGLMSRKEAWELVCEENKPRYEALQWYFETLGLDGDRVLTVVDRMKRLY